MLTAAHIAQNNGRDAVLLFKRAFDAERDGAIDEVIELLNKTIALCEEELQDNCMTCVAAHIRLYRLYNDLDRDDKALEHFGKAVALGASADRLAAF